MVAHQHLSESRGAGGGVPRRRRRRRRVRVRPRSAPSTARDHQTRQQRGDQRPPGLRGAQKTPRYQRGAQGRGLCQAPPPLDWQSFQDQKRHILPRGPSRHCGCHQQLVAEGPREQGTAAGEAGSERESGGGQGSGRRRRRRRGRRRTLIVFVKGVRGSDQYIGQRRPHRVWGWFLQSIRDGARVGGRWGGLGGGVSVRRGGGRRK